VKQSPELHAIQENMRSGSLAGFGFLGSDTRQLIDILEADDALVTQLGTTHGDIARRLQFFYTEGRKGLGQAVEVERRYDVVAEEHKGGIPCPFRDNHTAPKVMVSVTDQKTGQRLSFSALNIHMIQAHGFYEGHGAKFRIEPATVMRILF